MTLSGTSRPFAMPPGGDRRCRRLADLLSRPDREANLLPKLFTEVIVPSAVLDELRAEGSPSVVRQWALEHPEWIIVRDPVAASAVGRERLHAGEREAIRVAEEMKADLILLDEKTARRIAVERGLRVTGLLGVLAEAVSRELADLPSAIDQLTWTNFRYSPSLSNSPDC